MALTQHFNQFSSKSFAHQLVGEGVLELSRGLHVVVADDHLPGVWGGGVRLVRADCGNVPMAACSVVWEIWGSALTHPVRRAESPDHLLRTCLYCEEAPVYGAASLGESVYEELNRGVCSEKKGARERTRPHCAPLDASEVAVRAWTC